MYATTNPTPGELVEEFPTLSDASARDALPCSSPRSHSSCSSASGLVLEVAAKLRHALVQNR